MATPRTARRAALVLAGALGLAFAPAPAGAEEPTTAAEAAALVAARGHELEVLTEDFNEARELLAGQHLTGLVEVLGEDLQLVAAGGDESRGLGGRGRLLRTGRGGREGQADDAGQDEGSATGGARGRHGAAALRSSTAAYQVS